MNHLWWFLYCNCIIIAHSSSFRWLWILWRFWWKSFHFILNGCASMVRVETCAVFHKSSCVVCFQLMIPPILYEYVSSFVVMDGSRRLSHNEAVLQTLNQLIPQWHELSIQLTNGWQHSLDYKIIWVHIVTMHRVSTSVFSLTFCVRVILPERHQWKPAVQSVAVMLRTPPIDGQSPASSVRRPRRVFALRDHIVGWTQACN